MANSAGSEDVAIAGNSRATSKFRRRWLRTGLVIGLAVAVVVLLISWSQERDLSEVERLLAAGDVDVALAAADQFLASHPSHSHALALRARALVELGRFPEAQQVFAQVGAADAASLKAYAKSTLAVGDREQALPLIQRFLQLEPDDPEGLQFATICYYDLGQRFAAVESAKRLSRLPGQEVTGHFQLASIYREWGYPSLATPHYQQVLQHEPDAGNLPIAPAEFFLDYGLALLRSGNARAATESLDRSLKQKHSIPALLHLGEAWQVLGRLADAQACFEQVVEGRRQHTVARQHLAEISLEEGRPADAINWLQPSTDTDAVNAEVAYLLQRAYTNLGDNPQAEQWQQRTAELRRKQQRLRAWQVDAERESQSIRGRLYQVYQDATLQDWEVAAARLAILLRENPNCYEFHFVQELVVAIRDRGTLPPVETLPSNLE